jgi:uncharacterized protein YjdB
MSLIGLVRSPLVRLTLIISLVVALSSCASNARQDQAQLTSLGVSPVKATIATGTTQQFTATGRFTDGSSQDMTAAVAWNSQNPSIAVISSSGLVTAKSAGSTVITATSGSVSGSMSLTVAAATLKSIAITPANATLSRNATQQFTATATLSDGSTQKLSGSVTWSSATPSVATISATGLATALAAGSSTIQASSGDVTGSATLTVTAASLSSIVVTPANPSIAKGLTDQFTATGRYSDGSTENITNSVTWSSSNPSVATISVSGLATSVAAGSSTMQAALGSIKGTTTLTVAASSAALMVLVVSPQNPVLSDASSTQSFTAIGHYSDGSTQDLTNSASWSSSNTGAATVSSSGSATSEALPAGQPTGYTSIKATVGTIAGVSILSVTNHASNASGFAGVFTQHNDNFRTGQNPNETILTPVTVKSGTTFGKKFSQVIDGYAYAQPLYVPHVTIGGTSHNVVFVATENDSVYAFDAESNAGASASPLWQANLISTAHGAAAGATPVSNVQANCGDLVPKIGITSTPVIDPSTGTMYVETKSSEGSAFVHRLHALDITTGNEKFSGPAVITASVSATGGTVTFDGLRHLNRPGLLWLNGLIYLAYASHCDNTPYHGWLFAYDASTLSQRAAFLTTPEATSNGGLAGFWMSGAGIAADSDANIFITTGNGDFDTTNIPAKLLGDTVMELFFTGASVSLVDYFTPYDQGSLDGGDTDLGSGGTLLLPDQSGTTPHELIQVGKSGTIYVINRDAFTAGNLHYCKTCTTRNTQIAQEIQGAVGGLWNMPAYWNNSVYFVGAGDSLKSFSLINGAFPTSASASTGSAIGYPGATPSVSSNGNSNGIVWVIQASGGAAVLLAYDPANGLAALYSSSSQGGRDTAGAGVKFSVPTIANGNVFVGTQTELDVYGLLP